MTMPASEFFAVADNTPLVSMVSSNMGSPISNVVNNPISNVVNNPISNVLSAMNVNTMQAANTVRVENQQALQLALEITLMQIQERNAKNGSHNLDGGMPVNGEMDAYRSAEDKKASSHNMTECVPVPSSEHVAEIVGRQGCKIKALRAKTNTYIKTPVRGEEPVFVVTGRSEDVANAKVEIMSAADHFSQIRACRKNNTNGSMAPGPPNVPGQVTYEVKVPYRVVGLVVGPKGATIKRIQQQTQTYIVTPSREKDPIFEVTGLPENVCMAKKEIEAHIAMRTGADNNYGPGYDEQVAAALAIVNGGRPDNQPLDSYLNNPDFLNSLCKYNEGSNNSLNVSGMQHSNGLNGSSLHFGNNIGALNASMSNGLNSINGMGHIANEHGIGGLPSLNGYGSDLGTFSNSESSVYSSNGRGQLDLPPIGSHINGKLGSLGVSNGLYENGLDRHCNDGYQTHGTSIWSDAGKTIGTPLSMSTMPNGRAFSSAVGTFGRIPYASANNSNTVSPDFSDTHPTATRSSSDPNCLRNALPGFAHPPIDPSISPSTQSLSSSPELALVEERMNSVANSNQKCIVCMKSNVVAALIPCGHNLFCLDCANNLVSEKSQCKSPVCDQIPTDSIRILRSN